MEYRSLAPIILRLIGCAAFVSGALTAFAGTHPPMVVLAYLSAGLASSAVLFAFARALDLLEDVCDLLVQLRPAAPPAGTERPAARPE